MTNINFNIDFKIDCYSFEEINLEDGKLEIGYIEFENNLVLLSDGWYMEKKEFINNENKTCLVGNFGSSVLENDFEPNELATEFTIEMNGKINFKPNNKHNTQDEIKKFSNLKKMKAEIVFVSFIHNNGTRDDLSTSDTKYIDIS